MISKWNYLPLTTEEQKLETQLAKAFASCPPISELLVQRGITSVEEAEKFFHPSLKDMHDPFLMPDMDKAVNRLNKAMGSKEKIMVYGDYDVDGTTAVALVYKYLQNYYSNIEYYIPTRYDEGYGISKRSIDYAASIGVKLIIILDCGIKAIEEIASGVGDPQLVEDAKYGDAPCTAPELALKAMQQQAKLGAKHLQNAAKDFNASGADGVGAVPNGGAGNEPEDEAHQVKAVVDAYNMIKGGNNK